jgi:hypothetical protein
MKAIEERLSFGRALLGSIALGLGLAACGGSGGGPFPGTAGSAGGCVAGDPSTANECGSVLVALTDAEGDFASYTVDVLSISLERASGARVEMLPAAARVDFAQLTELSELVSAATLAPGDIVGGRIRIDYSDAEIYVETGGEIVPAEVYDGAGNLLTAATDASVVDVEIELPELDRLLVTRGRTSLLSLDFDLAASHTADTSVDPVRIVAKPYLTAEVEPVDVKEIRVRGSLAGVDVDAGTYDIKLRPWHHRLGDYGELSVITDGATEFEIDGMAYVGRAGLEALAAKPEGTLTVAFGTLDLNDRSFTAEIVHAGDSLGGNRYSAVMGNIVARTGDELVVKGALVIRRDRRAHFHRTVIVNVGAATAVTRIGDPGAEYDKDDLSVGQRMIALGELVNPSVDDSNRFGPDVALVLDATEGRARMLVTRLHGTVDRVLPGQIDVRLSAIDRLGVGLFDFSGTGVTAGLDADPMSYEIATSALALDALEIGRPVRVLGFVSPFGEAPPDFEGRTLIGPRDLPAALGIGWGSEGTAAPFSVMGASSLVVDLGNPEIGLRHHLLVGAELIDLFDLPASPEIVASDSRHIYGIWEPGHIELFEDFAAFVEELALRLGGADRAQSLAAYGRYSETGNSLSANKIVVHMIPAESL